MDVPNVVLYRIAGTEPLATAARAVELEVFRDCYGDTPELLADSYGPYEAASIFVLAVVGEQPAGVIRYIRHSDTGNKTLNDVERDLGLPPAAACDYHRIASLDACADIGTLALRPQFRRGRTGREIARQLVSVAHADLLAAGIEHVTAIMAPAAYVGLVKLLGMPFESLADTGPLPYLGVAKSRAVYLRLPNEKMARLLGDVPEVSGNLYDAVGSATTLSASK